MVELDVLLAEGARFAVWWRDHDIALLPRAGPIEGALVFAEDRSGGKYVLLSASTDEAAGVWLRSSEGERRWLAQSVVALFERLASGFTVADILAKHESPSARPAPGVARWLATKR